MAIREKQGSLGLASWNRYCKRVDQFGSARGLTEDDLKTLFYFLPSFIYGPERTKAGDVDINQESAGREFVQVLYSNPVAAGETLAFAVRHYKDIHGEPGTPRSILLENWFDLTVDNAPRARSYRPTVRIGDLSDTQLRHVRGVDGSSLARRELAGLLRRGEHLWISERHLSIKQLANAAENAWPGFLTAYARPGESAVQTRLRLEENMKADRRRMRIALFPKAGSL